MSRFFSDLLSTVSVATNPRNLFLLCFAICFGGFTASPVNAADGPRVEVTERIYNFLSVSEGCKVTHDFKVSNSGNESLALTRIVASCGCVTSTANNTLIEPGQSANISVVFDTSGLFGDKDRAIRVFTNDENSPLISFVLKGNVVAPFELTPERVVLKGAIVGDLSAVKQRVRVAITDPKLLLTESDSSSNPIPQAQVKKLDARVFSDKLVITDLQVSHSELSFDVGLMPTLPPGEVRDRVIVEIPSSPPRRINIPVYAQIKSPFQITTERINFGVVKPGDKKSKVVKIRVLGRTPIKIVGVESSEPAVKTRLREIEAGWEYELDVSLETSQARDFKGKGSIRGVLAIITDPENSYVSSLTVAATLPPS